MSLSKQLLAKVDGRLRAELDHSEDVQLVKVPVSDAVWPTWSPSTPAQGLSQVERTGAVAAPTTSGDGW